MPGARDLDAVLDLNRIRWRCRRGMLELDMVLERFLHRHMAELTESQRREFERLIRLEDQILWQRISGTDAGGTAIEGLLRDCVVR